MKASKQSGWMLVEAMFSIACVAFVISLAQQQQNQLTQQMQALQTQHQQKVQQSLQLNMRLLFGQAPALNSSSLGVPNCQRCRGAALQHLLQYELNQW
ncbi:hypothetical protein MAQ5080_00516 [Marinomonas aquimarina]|uniref:Uncharacterized protein n=1 Tax=Marinomonas aquimarina TaxID=295068 RepID=A0A1A8T4J6_9GAMM|nr:hypothetical protein [Marinomonas aquimarina]SBS26425.1 hypothetical protein MAQ5080_00516 [Marinomonas aquimarina]